MRTLPPGAAQARRRPDIDLTQLWARVPGPPVALAGPGPDGRPILLVGSGPCACTSAQTVASLRAVKIYDVNGFYAALQVAPEASWPTLVNAYLAAGGPQDAWLTEILKILKNPVTRRAYDRMLPHQRYADRRTMEGITRAEAQRRLRESDPLLSVFDTENSNFGARNARQSAFDTGESVPRDMHQAPVAADGWSPSGWGYSHYLWDVLSTPSASADLPRWQEMIISALGGASAPAMHFGVGRSPVGSDPIAIRVGSTAVAFLSAGTAPQHDLAERAASQLRAL